MKDVYLAKGVTDTVVSKQVDGVPHRVLNTALIEELEIGQGQDARPAAGVVERAQFRGMTGLSLNSMLREGLAMRKALGLSWTQMVMAANTPMLLKASLVDGRVDSGDHGERAGRRA